MKIILLAIQSAWLYVRASGGSLASFYSRSVTMRSLTSEYLQLAKVTTTTLRSRYSKFLKGRPLSPALAKALALEAGATFTIEIAMELCSSVFSYVDTSSDNEFSLLVRQIANGDGSIDDVGALGEILYKDLTDVTLFDAIVYSTIVIGVILRLRRGGFALTNFVERKSSKPDGFSLKGKGASASFQFFSEKGTQASHKLTAIAKNPVFYAIVVAVGLVARRNPDVNDTSKAVAELPDHPWYASLTLADPEVYRLIQEEVLIEDDVVSEDHVDSIINVKPINLGKYGLDSTLSNLETQLLRLRDKIDKDGVVPIRRH